ncbi:DUF4198 domain-containing protein [Chitinophaga horti]|uniref:DUF4198 domain-containing protein n=1 Tax=Chitinophaga horti TaxID=2920382 RepID=A0ABY6J7P1_9BACT|nr:DUF4198 domain-containing protein [Chitinophaga horti]UYQ95703.1 DUF4198 domain-containing protein [Chitinophaga horti]
MIKKLFLLTAVICVSLAALAHEFWLQPLKFWLKKNEATNISILVGEDYKGEKSDWSKYKIQQLKHYSAEGAEDYTAHLSAADKSIIEAKFAKAGNHLIAFNNSNKFIELEAEKFNEYLETEGLGYIAELRKSQQNADKPGREFYQRCVKTLFKVGGKNDSTFAVNTGMRLELIPRQNPYTMKNGDQMTMQVLFDNQPVKGALVLAWNVVDEKTSVTRHTTNEAGEVMFPVTLKGRWMISSVHMTPYTASTEADWQSYWGSYTFGYY